MNILPFNRLNGKNNKSKPKKAAKSLSGSSSLPIAQQKNTINVCIKPKTILWIMVLFKYINHEVDAIRTRGRRIINNLFGP